MAVSCHICMLEMFFWYHETKTWSITWMSKSPSPKPISFFTRKGQIYVASQHSCAHGGCCINVHVILTFSLPKNLDSCCYLPPPPTPPLIFYLFTDSLEEFKCTGNFYFYSSNPHGKQWTVRIQAGCHMLHRFVRNTLLQMSFDVLQGGWVGEGGGRKG